MVWLYKAKIWWKCKTLLYGYSFIVHVKADDIYKNVAKDAETRFDTSNFELDRPLKEKIKKKLDKWKMN